MEKDTSVTVCPYDSKHIIHVSRLQRHLIKCSQQFPPGYKQICPFNATHRVFEHELKKHIKMCPDQKYINPERFSFALKNHGSLKSCPPSESEFAKDIYDDNWEDDVLTVVDTASEHNQSSNQYQSPIPNPSPIPVAAPRALNSLPKQRRPFSYAAANALEFNDTLVADDNMSVTSSSMGRGRTFKRTSYENPNVRAVGRGQPRHYDMSRIGISATTDVSDIESVFSEALDG